ncbi:MAG: septum formation initiator family protein [Clostridia bacterium]|nr:septum formation initiator family protein [Clostridia bacterium]
MHARLEPRFYHILIVMLILILSVCLVASVNSLHAVRRERTAVEAQKRALETRAVSLQEQAAYAQTDDYIAEVARNELEMLLPGEVLYRAAD